MFEIFTGIVITISIAAAMYAALYFHEKSQEAEKARKIAEEKRVAKAHEDLERDMDKFVGGLCEDFIKMMIQVPFEIAKEESKKH